jgi:hypothetical protein
MKAIKFIFTALFMCIVLVSFGQNYKDTIFSKSGAIPCAIIKVDSTAKKITYTKSLTRNGEANTKVPSKFIAFSDVSNYVIGKQFSEKLVLFGRDSIKVTSYGISVAKFKSPHSDNVTYQKIINWVNSTYKNSDKVLTGSIPGESVTISGYASNAWYFKSLGTTFVYDMSYHIYVKIKDSLVTFEFVDDAHYYNGAKSNITSTSFFKKNGEYIPSYNTAKTSLEGTINALWFSFFDKVISTQMTSEEALDELKQYKDKLDLGLISQEEYDKKKVELSKYIK